jgi:hypothetical protein
MRELGEVIMPLVTPASVVVSRSKAHVMQQG